MNITDVSKTKRSAIATFLAAISMVAPAQAQSAPADPLAALPQSSGAAGDSASDAAAQLIRWVAGTHDNQGRPFVVVDKVSAQVLAFDSDGQPVGASPALLGIARGDDSAPGVGDRELRKIPVADRTTPAGRFVAKYGPAGGGHARVLWVDYGTAVSLHPVITANAKEHRSRRIKSATPDDNRITFGCINVPASFYSKVVKPLFAGKDGGVVYILPETKTLAEVFPGMTILQQAAL